VTFLNGLHGSVATLLLCVLLYIDEAGVPMPLAPNEVLLIGAGLLIASGAIAWFIFMPLAIVAMTLGSFSGFSFARRVGGDHLRGIASKLGGGGLYDRTARRMQSASWRAIFVSRLIPGIRPYATLVSGATQVSTRKFMTATAAAIVPWSIVITSLGFFAGIPAEHFLKDFEKLALSGGLLLALALIGYRAATRAGAHGRHERLATFHSLARRDRYWLAATVDFGVVATVTAGIDELTRAVGFELHSPFASGNGGFIDVLTIVAAIALVYLVLSRKSAKGVTAGERLFDVTYVHSADSKEAE
jgi:membrane-associated protein